ncbi:MAG: hypothetical protein Q9227_002099 [Pyrenula ochraceoflavens]
MKERLHSLSADETESVSSQESIPARPFSSEGEGMEMQNDANPDEQQVHDNSAAPGQVLSKLLQNKEQEWAAVAQKREEKGPLQLLDLPVDVLKEIVREVTHTNDLTSLALTHSALHALAIPHIYSRFDIVWPDGHASSDNRTGVDALTYGLATLVMDQDVFGEPRTSTPKFQAHKCSNCGRLEQCSHSRPNPILKKKRTRRGNYFAQYTRKFSLGNGPADWVQEYLITKEGGKMLGTLVALAVARMRNLETFVWDMPTGILRDIWLALASLGDRDDGVCSLENVWVRWHDNSESPPPPAGQSTNPTLMTPTMFSSTVSPGMGSSSLFHIPPYPRVEFPTFSILPPLKSISSLDIDELPYVEEMSILLEKSKDRLREIRIGIAQHAQYDAWVRLPEDKNPVPAGSSTGRSLSRPGGVLGILLGRLFDLPTSSSTAGSSTMPLAGVLPGIATEFGDIETEAEPELSATLSSPHIEVPFTVAGSQDFDTETKLEKLTTTLENQRISEDVDLGQKPAEESTTTIDPNTKMSFPEASPTVKLHTGSSRINRAVDQLSILTPHQQASTETSRYFTKDDSKLKLDVFKLERVPLSIPVLSKAIDWTRLSSLTIFGCQHHEHLWKALRKKYTPQGFSRTSLSLKPSPKPHRASSGQFSTPASKSYLAQEYSLKIKRLQTDCVSTSFLAFIRDTLAPDSLEWLFLQDGRPYKSNVTIDAIYKGAIRRHKGSLQKLLIDSQDRLDNGEPGQNNHWRKWMFNREVLTYVTSGRMVNLRELGMSLEYKDWLAMQILDIVTLRPELELCYLGIQSKCFEILELPAGSKSFDASTTANNPSSSDFDSDEDDDDGTHPSVHHDVHDDTESEISSAEHGDSDDDDLYGGESLKNVKHFKLREILFYDDKVSIFKARHGRI